MDGIKNYTLIVLGIPYPSFLLSSFIVNTFYVMKNVLIGYQLNEIGELLTHQKKWSSIDLAEKCFFGAVLFLIVFSFAATAVFTIWAQRRMTGKDSHLYERRKYFNLLQNIKSNQKKSKVRRLRAKDRK